MIVDLFLFGFAAPASQAIRRAQFGKAREHTSYHGAPSLPAQDLD